MSAEQREELRVFRQEAMNEIASGIFGAAEMAENVPDELKAFAEEKGIDLEAMLEKMARKFKKNGMRLPGMTGQSAEAIQAKFKDKGMSSVMQELNIDRQVFRSAMQAKVSHRIKEAAANGTITAEQEQEILEKMKNRVQRREIMNRLVEKGVEDGTIMPEQARTLFHKPF